MGNPNMAPPPGGAAAQMSFQGNPEALNDPSAPVASFQLNAIIGAANAMSMPVEVMIGQALGLQGPGPRAQDLTYDQGVKIMDYVNQITNGQSLFNV